MQQFVVGWLCGILCGMPFAAVLIHRYYRRKLTDIQHKMDLVNRGMMIGLRDRD